MTRFVLLLPSGWCPIAANLLTQVEDQIAGSRVHRRSCQQLARAMDGVVLSGGVGPLPSERLYSERRRQTGPQSKQG